MALFITYYVLANAFATTMLWYRMKEEKEHCLSTVSPTVASILNVSIWVLFTPAAIISKAFFE